MTDIEKSLEYWERRLRGIKKELMYGYDISVTGELVKYKQAMEERDNEVETIVSPKEKLFTLKEMFQQGTQIGDIIATPAFVVNGTQVWYYYLLRDGNPDEFNVALSCNDDPRHEGFRLFELGFHWVGPENINSEK